MRLWMMQELEVAGNLLSLEELEAFGFQELEVLGREFFKGRKLVCLLFFGTVGWEGTTNTKAVETVRGDPDGPGYGLAPLTDRVQTACGAPRGQRTATRTRRAKREEN